MILKYIALVCAFNLLLSALLVVVAPMIYSGLQNGGDPATREQLENMLDIFKRGMGAKSAAETVDKETVYGN